MNQYIKNNRVSFWCAVICVFLSDLCAVVLQFFKGNILDYAVAKDAERTIGYAVLLIVFILLEIDFSTVTDGSVQSLLLTVQGN